MVLCHERAAGNANIFQPGHNVTAALLTGLSRALASPGAPGAALAAVGREQRLQQVQPALGTGQVCICSGNLENLLLHFN